MFQSRRSKARKFALVAPVAIVALVVAACSPGSAQTTAPIYNQITGDYLKVSAQCLNQGGLCAGVVSLTSPDGSHFISANTGAGGGFSKLTGGDCTAAPCPEGGEAGLAGNGAFYANAGSTPLLASYSIDGFDYDSATGLQTKADKITFNLCLKPFAGSYCGSLLPADAKETFTCVDQGAHSCFEVTLRPGSFLGPSPVRH